MIKKIRKCISWNHDYLIILLSIVVFFSAAWFMYPLLLPIYEINKLNELILNLSGNLFGLLLTAYTILFGLIPALRKEVLETESFEQVNNVFMFGLFIGLVTILMSFFVYFVGTIQLLVVIQLTLVGTLISTLLGIILPSLYFLFKIVKKDELSS